MKSNNRFALVAMLLGIAACFFTACGTPSQQVATANYLAGNAFATHELAKSPANLKGLTDLAAALPGIPTGKVTPFQMGVLNAELAAINATAKAPDVAPKNQEALSQIGSLLSASVQAYNAQTGGNPTAATAIASAALEDFANGINHAILFWQGQQSTVVIPPPSS